MESIPKAVIELLNNNFALLNIFVGVITSTENPGRQHKKDRVPFSCERSPVFDLSYNYITENPIEL